MRDGETEGMQYFDHEIEKMIRAGIIGIEVGLSYSTNQGNLRLQLADLLDGQDNFPAAIPQRAPARETELEIEK